MKAIGIKTIQVSPTPTLMTKRDLAILKAMVSNMRTFIKDAEALANKRIDQGSFSDLKEVEWALIVETK